jgi:CheY-like chemotaxis protein
MTVQKTILIVDDDDDDRELFETAVSKIDATVNCISADSAKKALYILEEIPQLPDFIFLDLNMPGMDGKALLKHLRSRDKFDKIMVVIYSTAKIAESDKLAYPGADYFFTKPALFQSICDMISEIIRKKEYEKKR